MTELRTPRLRLRTWRDDDLGGLARMNADPQVVRYLTPGGQPMTRAQTEEQLARFRRHWEEHGFGVFALEERAGARLVGRCGPAFHRLWPDDPELGWKLDPAVWGRGYATEAGAACLDLLFGELAYDRVVSIVLPENARSIRVQERLGFEPWREVRWDDTGQLLQVRSLTRAGREHAAARLQSSG